MSAQTINHNIVVKLLTDRRKDLTRLGVKSLALFGSVARGDNRPESDIDLLVEFEGSATFDGYLNLKDFLEELLNRKVDLVTRKALKPRLRPQVEKEAIHVA